MKLRIVVEIDPPSAERCWTLLGAGTDSERVDQCCRHMDLCADSADTWRGFCALFDRDIAWNNEAPTRLPECIAAEQWYDNPEWDATDAAHPAWWRGQDHGAASVVREANRLLDEAERDEERRGVFGDREMERLAERLNPRRQPADRVATDPVIWLCQDAADNRAGEARGGEE